ncbi:MAG: DNA-processing protein DprA [Pseudomonadota bacterium]
MPIDARIEAWLRLCLTPGLGDRARRQLLQAFGGPEEALAASPAAVEKAAGGPAASALRQGPDPDQVARSIEWLAQTGNRLIPLEDPDYPPRLLELADPPTVLYAKGRVELLGHPSLAVVGSRSATAQGIANAEAFARALSDRGLTIVSGLALGIDAAAHAGGLAGDSSSVAVVGTGLDLVYPARNRALAHRLAEDGLLVSEFPLDTPARAANFPRRNRILSGLSLGVLVVEAALHSGSLITARLAAEQGREVFALPGSIHSPLSKGCHRLIKEGAKLVESAQDVLEELGFPAGAPAQAGSGPGHPLLVHLGFDPVDAGTLATRSGLTPQAVAAALLELELAGQVVSLPGGRYQRLV